MIMENQLTRQFIVIDDDPINNHICRRYIEIVFPKVAIQTFTNPEEGLEYIQSKYPLSDDLETVLFLDINMPVLSGWDVLDRFINFADDIKQQFKIYILSSSVALEDKQKASSNPLVTGFLEKPLTTTQLRITFSG